MKNINIYMDAGYNPITKRMIVDLLIETPDEEIRKFISIEREGSAIEAEYLSLIWAIQKIKSMYRGKSTISIFSKNSTTIQQINGKFRVNNPALRALIEEMKKLTNGDSIYANYLSKSEIKNKLKSDNSQIYSDKELKEILNQIDSTEDIWT